MIYGPDKVGIAIKNSTAVPGQYVAVPGIGVKNISLMMEQMAGKAEVSMTEEEYKIVLYFPLQSGYGIT